MCLITLEHCRDCWPLLNCIVMHCTNPFITLAQLVSFFKELITCTHPTVLNPNIFLFRDQQHLDSFHPVQILYHRDGILYKRLDSVLRRTSMEPRIWSIPPTIGWTSSRPLPWTEEIRKIKATLYQQVCGY